MCKSFFQKISEKISLSHYQMAFENVRVIEKQGLTYIIKIKISLLMLVLMWQGLTHYQIPILRMRVRGSACRSLPRSPHCVFRSSPERKFG